MKQFTYALWVISITLMGVAALGQAPGVSDVVKVADIAREKDVVWLSLVTAMGAMGFSVFLVLQLRGQYRDAREDMQKNSDVHAKNADAVSALANSLDDLRREMERRPCVLPSDRR